jgi:hypothetical protein
MLEKFTKFLASMPPAEEWLKYIADGNNAKFGVLDAKWTFFAKTFDGPRAFAAFVNSLDAELVAKIEEYIKTKSI